MTHLTVDLAVAHVERSAIWALHELVSALGGAPNLRLRRQDATFVMQWSRILHTSKPSIGRSRPNLQVHLRCEASCHCVHVEVLRLCTAESRHRLLLELTLK